MSFIGKWSVVFDDKKVTKKCDDFPGGLAYVIDDDDFWNQSKFSNIWAFQWTGGSETDQVEYKDATANSSYDASVLGDFSVFKTKWDATHLATIQATWDNDNVDGESSSEKITRLGARPTSYTSS